MLHLLGRGTSPLTPAPRSLGRTRARCTSAPNVLTAPATSADGVAPQLACTNGSGRISERPVRTAGPERPNLGRITPAKLAGLSQLLWMPITSVGEIWQQSPAAVQQMELDQVAQRLRDICATLGVTPQQAVFMVTRQPAYFLLTPLPDMRAKVEELSTALKVPPAAVLRAALTIPAILSCSTKAMKRRVIAYSWLLWCNRLDTLHIMARRPEYLSESPSAVLQRMRALGSALGASPWTVAAKLQVRPDLAFVSPQEMSCKVRGLMSIMDKEKRLVVTLLAKVPALLSCDLDCARAVYEGLQGMLRKRPGFVFAMVCHAPQLLLLPPRGMHQRCSVLRRCLAASPMWAEQFVQLRPPGVAQLVLNRHSCLGAMVFLAQRQWAGRVPLERLLAARPGGPAAALGPVAAEFKAWLDGRMRYRTMRPPQQHAAMSGLVMPPVMSRPEQAHAADAQRPPPLQAVMPPPVAPGVPQQLQMQPPLLPQHQQPPLPPQHQQPPLPPQHQQRCLLPQPPGQRTPLACQPSQPQPLLPQQCQQPPQQLYQLAPQQVHPRPQSFHPTPPQQYRYQPPPQQLQVQQPWQLQQPQQLQPPQRHPQPVPQQYQHPQQQYQHPQQQYQHPQQQYQHPQQPCQQLQHPQHPQGIIPRLGPASAPGRPPGPHSAVGGTPHATLHPQLGRPAGIESGAGHELPCTTQHVDREGGEPYSATTCNTRSEDSSRSSSSSSSSCRETSRGSGGSWIKQDEVAGAVVNREQQMGASTSDRQPTWLQIQAEYRRMRARRSKPAGATCESRGQAKVEGTAEALQRENPRNAYAPNADAKSRPSRSAQRKRSLWWGRFLARALQAAGRPHGRNPSFRRHMAAQRRALPGGQRTADSPTGARLPGLPRSPVGVRAAGSLPGGQAGMRAPGLWGRPGALAEASANLGSPCAGAPGQLWRAQPEPQLSNGGSGGGRGAAGGSVFGSPSASVGEAMTAQWGPPLRRPHRHPHYRDSSYGTGMGLAVAAAAAPQGSAGGGLNAGPYAPPSGVQDNPSMQALPERPQMRQDANGDGACSADGVGGGGGVPGARGPTLGAVQEEGGAASLAPDGHGNGQGKVERSERAGDVGVGSGRVCGSPQGAAGVGRSSHRPRLRHPGPQHGPVQGVGQEHLEPALGVTG